MLYSIFIKKRENARGMNAYWFKWPNIYIRDVVFDFFTRAHPPIKKISHYYPVTAQALRSHTHVSMFTLVVYWHNPNRTSIVSIRFLDSTTWRCRGRFSWSPKPILDYIYIGLYIKEIIGFSIAIVIISNPKGKKKILLTGVAYILSFYINLVYI